MRFCLYEREGEAAAGKPRLGLLRHRTVVDVHGLCLASLADHMTPKRARELARALCPADLLAFLENGRPAWQALEGALARLDGVDGIDPVLATPTGEPVVLPLEAVRLAPVVPWPVRYGGSARGTWETVDVPGTPAKLVTDGRAYLPEYLAVIGTPGERLTASEAWACVALVSETRPTDASDAAHLRTTDELTADDEVLRATVAAAVAEASAHRRLLPGDVVRTGLALVAHPVDIDVDAGADTEIDLRNPIGEALPAH